LTSNVTFDPVGDLVGRPLGDVDVGHRAAAPDDPRWTYGILSILAEKNLMDIVALNF